MSRILCIEDDAETRVIIKKSLEAAGMVVDTVWGGEKGVQAALNGRFDCVVLDIMMPEMDGFQVLHALRNNSVTQDLAVLIVTGRDDNEARERAAQEGADAYMTKPFEIARLVSTIKRIISERSDGAGVDT